MKILNLIKWMKIIEDENKKKKGATGQILS